MDDFINVYLSRSGGCGTSIIQEKEQLLQEIALFSIASHLFWGIWGIVNINQEIEFGYWVSFFNLSEFLQVFQFNFPLQEYANLRINEYFLEKEKYFKIKPQARDICDLEARRK